MDELKNVIRQLLRKLRKKGQNLFSQFSNVADDTITKIMFLLKENKEQLNDYLVDRKVLLNSIKQKQVELESLRLKITETDKGQTERLIQLYEKLELKTGELLHYKQGYYDVQQSIKASKKEIFTLNDEKNQVLDERNWLKAEYDHLQTIMEENIHSLSKLEDELGHLRSKKNEFTHADISDAKDKEIEDKLKEIEGIQQDKYMIEEKFKEVEKNLLEEVKRAAELSGRLHTVEGTLRENEQIMIEFENVIYKKKQQVKEERHKIDKLTAESVTLQMQANSYQEDYQIVLLELKDMDKILERKDDEYAEQMIKSEEKIEHLETALLNEKNKLAIESETKGAPAMITPEALLILEQEYEPRFQTLYKESSFKQNFYKDFYSLIPADRLRVEAVIANLNHEFDKAMTKTRPNTVKTHSGVTINEYPFGHDHAGRIYFKREYNKIKYFRISRTKNGRGSLDQKQVIAWLKANV